MSRLPPIQELVTAETDEQVTAWRERLAVIFQGLLEANADYRSITYVRVDGDQSTELVRSERYGKDAARVRVVPRSRLSTGKSNDFVTSVIAQKPEDVVTSLVCDSICDHEAGCDNDLGLCAGVPVYDQLSEETFGLIVIDCDIDRVMRRQMNRRMTADEVVVACDIFNVMMHVESGQIIDESIEKPVAEAMPHFRNAIDALQTKGEYIDAMDAEVYGIRLWLVPNRHGLMYLLRRKSD